MDASIHATAAAIATAAASWYATMVDAAATTVCTSWRDASVCAKDAAATDT